MGWLVCDGRVLASVDVLASRRDRARGLLGRDRVDGAVVLDRTRWVHTMGMRFPIDVAFIGRDGTVVKMVTMNRHRVGIPVHRAASVIEAEAGALGRWGLRIGDRVEIRA